MVATVNPESRWRPIIVNVVRWGGLIAVVVLAITLYGRADMPGPKASDAEAELTAYASEHGLEVTAECPETSESTPVGRTFECVVQSRSGAVRDVVVTNGEDDLSWDGQAFEELRQIDERAFG